MKTPRHLHPGTKLTFNYAGFVAVLEIKKPQSISFSAFCKKALKLIKVD